MIRICFLPSSVYDQYVQEMVTHHDIGYYQEDLADAGLLHRIVKQGGVTSGIVFARQLSEAWCQPWELYSEETVLRRLAHPELLAA